ncbi:MAG: diguanylate cyclase [Gemmobacter sp.]
MVGRVLMIGGTASARIVLKGRLGTACYEVATAPDASTALRQAAIGGHHAILLLLERDDPAAADLVRRLRAIPALADTPVVGIASAPDQPTLLAMLAAGADDVLTQPGEGVLLARLRNLLRHRAALADLGANAAPVQSLGFAEAPQGFAPPGRVTLVMRSMEAALHLRRELSALLPDQVTTLTASDALADGGLGAGRAAPDVFVIASDLDTAGGGLRLVAELLSRGSARHAAFCLLREGSGAAQDPMAFDLGASDVIDAAADPREVALRLSRVMARKRAGDRLRASVRDGLRLAVTDPLTGLHNRRYALSGLAAMAAALRDTGGVLSVMILDLDRFKRVNDDWGHAAGDAVLVEVARRLGASLRPGDLLARIGGEEFLVALPDTALPEACALAEGLCAAVQEGGIALPQGQRLRVTASIGLASGDAAQAMRPDFLAALLDRADQALRTAKSAGRNQVTVNRPAA